MTEEPPGLIVNHGRNHKHKLEAQLGGYLEEEIICKRFRCHYREVNPNGMEAKWKGLYDAEKPAATEDELLSKNEIMTPNEIKDQM